MKKVILSLLTAACIYSIAAPIDAIAMNASNNDQNVNLSAIKIKGNMIGTQMKTQQLAQCGYGCGSFDLYVPPYRYYGNQYYSYPYSGVYYYPYYYNPALENFLGW